VAYYWPDGWKQVKMELLSPCKIFVVDDDPFSLQIYNQLLINLGYMDVKTFDNGTACLEALTEQPAIIFLDHSMEIMNGIEVLKKIKRFNPDIYVIFISGQEDVETAVKSLKYGAFDYIVKGNNDRDRIEKVLLKVANVKELLKKRKRGFLKTIFSFI
jgi:DNA-binding NtrC family response regulator